MIGACLLPTVANGGILSEMEIEQILDKKTQDDL